MGKILVGVSIRNKAMPPRRRIVKIVCILVVTGLTLWVGLRGAIRARELQRRLVCASNLQGIATSPSPTRQIDPRSLICPSSRSSTSNYVLVPRHEGVPIDDRAVIAYEPKSNHGGEGGNMVFADGHASFVRVPEYDDLVHSITEADP